MMSVAERYLKDNAYKDFVDCVGAFIAERRYRWDEVQEGAALAFLQYKIREDMRDKDEEIGRLRYEQAYLRSRLDGLKRHSMGEE